MRTVERRRGQGERERVREREMGIEMDVLLYCY
jgi:hypothetical protein